MPREFVHAFWFLGRPEAREKNLVEYHRKTQYFFQQRNKIFVFRYYQVYPNHTMDVDYPSFGSVKTQGTTESQKSFSQGTVNWPVKKA